MRQSASGLAAIAETAREANDDAPANGRPRSSSPSKEPAQIERLDAALLAIAHFFESREVHALVQASGAPENRSLFRALRAVRDLPAPVSISDVQREVALSHPATCRLIDRCVAEGLIDRRQSASDRRHARLTLTEAGLDSARAMEQARQTVVAALFENWPSQDKSDLLTLLQRLGLDLARVRRRGADPKL
jgi:DNA-binding MarR family transcriptional regulator